jgi:hypothetical protein
MAVVYALDVLDHAARDGTFTPIIGAACSSLDHRGEPRHNLNAEIRNKARQIGIYLTKSERRYLSELIDYPYEDLADAPEQGPDDLLLAFCVVLLRLDRAAALAFKTGVEKYGNGTNSTCEFLWTRTTTHSFPRQVADWRIPLATSDFRDDVLTELRAAIAHAQRLLDCTAVEWHDRGLGAAGIVASLEALKTSLFDDASAETAAILTNMSRVGTVNVLDLVWIGNLFWHCLRFDTCYYPTTAELAFQLSLFAAVAPGDARKSPPLLAQAAQAAEKREGLITVWFSHYEKGSGTSAFYATLAQWLHLTFARYDQTHPSSSHRDTVPLPIVSTTNYDREIERALEHRRCSHHVVMPVRLDLATDAFTPSVSKPFWLMKNVDFDSDGKKTISWQYAGKTAASIRTLDPESPRQVYAGPVVVKLHGSPLEELPSSFNLPNPWSLTTNQADARCKHRLIIAESDYLDDLLQQIPLWVQKEFQRKRRKRFFLGHSVSDWNIRLRLASELNSEGTATRLNRESPVRRFVVTRRLGFFDSAFMADLAIGQLPSDLQEVHRVLQSQFSDIA